jgi:hypothetical protein
MRPFTEANLAVLGETFFVSRRPATYHECGRVIAEAVAHATWDEGGVLAPTKPTKHRPGASDKVAEGAVSLYGQPYRAVVVQSSSQDQRRLKRLEREGQASYATVRDAVRAAQRHDDFCRADAEAAAARLRSLPSAYHQVAVQGEARPTYGKGRPSTRPPRRVKEMRYGLTATLTEHAASLARQRAEADCFVLLTHVPTEGAMAHRAAEVLKAYKEQHGIEIV